ncbi:hypothetical protein Bca101_036673 [Brassica carinata]
MSSSDVVGQSAFNVLRLGRSSQFIVARLLRFLTNGHQNLNRSSVAGSTRVCNPGISQCSSFGIGLPLNVLGSLALWFVLLQYMESELVTGEDDAYRYTYIMGLPKTLQLDSEELEVELLFSVKGSTVCDAIVKDRSLVTCWCSSWSAGAAISRLSLWTIKKFFLSYSNMIFKDLSRLKRFNSEEAIEYRLIIVRPPRIKDDAPLQDET